MDGDGSQRGAPRGLAHVSRLLLGVADRRAVAIVSGIALAWCVTTALRFHGFFLHYAGPIGADDGYTMAMGERLLDGHLLPYVDGRSHRGPVYYWAAALAEYAGGRLTWAGARWLPAVTSTASLLLVFGTGLAVRRPLGGAIAAVLYAWTVFVAFFPSPGFAVTGEGVASPFCVAALLFETVAFERVTAPRRRRGFLLAAGLSAGLAGMAKQPALPILVPLVAWAVLRDRELTGSFRKSLRSASVLALGAFLVFAGIVVLYACHRQLGTFWYWFYTYNAHIYMQPYRGQSASQAFVSYMLYLQPWAVSAFLVGMSAPLAQGVLVVRRRAVAIAGHSALEAVAACLAFVCFVSAVSPMRFWPHYFLCVVPFAALALGLRAENGLRRTSESPGLLACVVVAVLPVALMAVTSEQILHNLKEQRRAGAWPKEAHEQVCGIVDSYSGSPAAPLFVWGFGAELYLTCHRHPASRFTYLTLVAGTVPPDWYNVHEERVARGAREDLVEDLRTERPPVIIDAPDTLGHVTMTQIPRVREYLIANYCMRGTAGTTNLGTVSIWVRKDRASCI
ncbi:MAG TPA: hypothetical protein VHC69_00435 [Polyangiaceae bacterium]|nr:hypothetical protein [Polyangiaceae bacterium]